MRTLKKTLALVLVFAMMIGFGAIGASAFTDVKADTKYNEEISVLNAIGVIDGMSKDNFAPDGTLTREQAAKVIAFVKLGPANAKLIGAASSQKFTDVPANRWSAGYIEYCANLGIISGVGDNKFAPEGKLTTAAFTKMLLVAVGFDAVKSGFVGDSWAINVATAAIKAGLNDESITISASRNITRGEACRLAYLAMFYSADGSTTKYTVMSGATPDVVVSTWDTFFEAYLVAEKLAGTHHVGTIVAATGSISEKVFALTKGTGNDSFGRPATTYTNAANTVNLKFANTPNFKFTSLQSNAAMAKALKGYTVSAANTAGYADTNAIAAATGNGKTVELFTTGKTVDKVVVIAPEFVTVTVAPTAATKAHGAYNTYTVTLSVGGTKTGKVYSTVVNAETDNDDAVVTGKVSNGDKVLAYYVGSTLYVEALSTVTGVLSAKRGDALTIGTDVYQKAAAGAAVGVNKDPQVFYVDSFGYIVASATATPSTANYAFVLDAYAYSVLDGNKVVTNDYAVLAFADGSVKEVVVAASATKGTAFTYVISPKGVYTLTEINGTTIDGTAGTTRLQATATAIVNKAYKMTADSVSLITDTTVFAFANFDSSGKPTGTVTVYTGKNNVPTTSSVAAGNIVAIDTSKTADGIADIVFVYAATTSVASDSFIYVVGTYAETLTGNVYDVIKAGKEDTITVPTGATGDTLKANTLYSNIIVGSSVSATKASVVTAYTSVQYKGGLLYTNGILNATNSVVGADVPVYVIDTNDNTVAVTKASAVTSVLTATIYLAVSGGTVTGIYVLTGAHAAN